MAFIGDEERFKDKPEDTPGLIYEPEKANHFKSKDNTMHNLAPFGSSADRLKLTEYEDKVLNKAQETNIPKKKPKEVVEYIRRNAAFANQEERFEDPAKRIPGPGHYHVPSFIGENMLEIEKKRMKVYGFQKKKDVLDKQKDQKREKLQKKIKKEFFKDKSDIEMLDYSANKIMKIPTGKGPNSTFVKAGNVKSLLKNKRGKYVGFSRDKKYLMVS